MEIHILSSMLIVIFSYDLIDDFHVVVFFTQKPMFIKNSSVRKKKKVYKNCSDECLQDENYVIGIHLNSFYNFSSGIYWVIEEVTPNKKSFFSIILQISFKWLTFRILLCEVMVNDLVWLVIITVY